MSWLHCSSTPGSFKISDSTSLQLLPRAVRSHRVLRSFLRPWSAKTPHPPGTVSILDRGRMAFWVAFSKVWRDWRSPLVLVKPATVIAWHRRGFRRYWRWRSRKSGRPRIPAEHIALIRRISSDQPGTRVGEAADPAGDRLGQEAALPDPRQ
jgi:hypothetical protein